MRLGLVTQSDLDEVLAGERAEAEHPKAVARPSSHLISAHDPFDPFSENVRALRTELLMRAPADDANVIVIVSPGRGEGRSRLASELAISFAQLGQATLLVDADLRRSTLHDLFSADHDEGLSQALMEGRAPKVQGVLGLASLSLLTAGRRPSTPLELLSDPTFGEMLSGWKRRYRHLILDTPAVSLYSDALAVATHAQRVLIVSRLNHTMIAQARDMIRRLESTRATIIGSVLNRF
ncbi:capsular exopolysaccharide synthesis family protein [Panacagrimonas perspica]|uniref:Capsular exopolysaccharide synthesis family protein n=2 Tax=Panacagrimonas perspica TaxID=381431 RepID=A0A4R7PDV1_9GAMM|nr:capsular exopolysaccharide synthesis family protein [Panacagrimonas perspica]